MANGYDCALILGDKLLIAGDSCGRGDRNAQGGAAAVAVAVFVGLEAGVSGQRLRFRNWMGVVPVHRLNALTNAAGSE